MMKTRLAGVVAGVALAISALGGSLVAPAGALHAQLKPPAGRLYGFVQVDDHGADDGTLIVAHVADQVCGQANYDANRGLYIIDLDSSNDTCAQMDATVWFSVGNCTAYNTGTVPEYSGAEEVDLVAPSTC
jgi:hypothetical protein